jgi:hypothetical protein
VARLFKKKNIEDGEDIVERPVLVEVYKWLDGTIEVYNGGTIATPVDSEGRFTFNGKSCEVHVLNDGWAVAEKRQTGGEQVLVTENKIVDATTIIDPERLARLTDDEKDILSAISYVEIHETVIDALEATTRKWTAFVDACQDADQKLKLPKSSYLYVPKFKWEDGRTVIEFDVHLAIDGVLVEQFVSVLPYDLDDRIVPLKEGTPVAEKKYCGAGDKRGSTFIYRFSIPKSYFK